MATALIVLAAGKGTRMKSDLPKVLHEVANAPLYAHALQVAGEIDIAKTIIVAGHGAAQVEASAAIHAPFAEIVTQSEQLGTGHAVLTARDALAGFDGDAIVLYGDTPFIRPKTLARMQDARRDGADVVVLGFEAADPGRYGRLVVEGNALTRIVEYKDASDVERAIRLCNSGVICASCENLFDLLDATNNDNAAGEYYLTDIVGIAVSKGQKARVVTCDEAETLGVNSRTELAQAEGIFQARKRAEALENGVTMQAPESVFFSLDTHIGRDAFIEPNVVFGPGVTVETGARIRAFSHLEDCHVSRDAQVGPYARLRPGAELAEGAKVGNFVEVKNAQVGPGAKVNHLTYIGDATIGERANIGAGTVTCNYDGVSKHHTEIGADSFIGSDTMLVAPVKIGKGAMTATGSVVTRDVPDGAMAIGRAKLEIKEGFWTQMFEKLKQKKKKAT
ncbi:MAG: bifunctional N-acetylglucosamine-1-phosphate uridyltransferase/glucosamine-1-phosphate acetyltransferase [Rhodobacterales bacterium]|nr:MAG: bifunctional N-acetylglucosamine-1-phosphate uridyltransferase/glucosamine-1-phosphate acetyltransferase [Rhodobacterales bacterium]